MLTKKLFTLPVVGDVTPAKLMLHVLLGFIAVTNISCSPKSPLNGNRYDDIEQKVKNGK